MMKRIGHLSKLRQLFRNNFRINILRYVEPKPIAVLKWIGVDLDGTLAHSLWTSENPTSEIGLPIKRNVKKLHRAIKKGYKPIIHTSRPWTDYQNIEGWLQHYNIPFKEIQCGKPLYHRYIDDRAIKASAARWF